MEWYSCHLTKYYHFIKIEIIDPTGKLLNSVNVNGNGKTTIPANYTTDIYLIRIYGNHKMMTQKIFVY